MLSNNNNSRRRISRDHTRKNGSVHHKQVIGAVDFGVEVHDCGAAAGSAVVDAHFGGADPVVGTTAGGDGGDLRKKGGLVGGWWVG